MDQNSGSVSSGVGRLSDFAPSLDSLPQTGQAHDGVIELGVRFYRGRLDFTMKDISGDFVRFDEDALRRFVAIDKNTRLKIRLDSKVRWQFDFDAGPIRLKNGESAEFYKVTRISDREILMEIKSTGSEDWTVHPFNVYVLVEQRLGPALPIRIDPDVDNPPRTKG